MYSKEALEVVGDLLRTGGYQSVYDVVSMNFWGWADKQGQTPLAQEVYCVLVAMGLRPLERIDWDNV